MKKRKNIIIYSVVLVAIVLTVSLTYAYLSVSDKQLNTNNFTSGCLSISIENESAAINLTNAYPISDKEGLELEAYTFTIKNNCSTATNYEINLESLNETEDTLNGDYVKVAISSDTNENILSVLTDNDIKTNLIEGSYASHNLYTGSIEGSKTKSFSLRIWIDYNTTKEQALQKTYTSQINVIANPEVLATNFHFYQETTDESYEEISAMPTSGYIIDEEASYCNLNNTKDTNATIYTSSAIKHILKNITNGSDCHIYFNNGFIGEGTSSDPYQINTINDLVTLSNFVNSGNTYSGKTFQLSKSLDFQNEADYINANLITEDLNHNGAIEPLITELTTGDGFTPIGLASNADKTYYFSGTFNGGNNKISNLYIYNRDKTEYNIGFFGTVKESTIKNLSIQGSLTSNVVSGLGGIVGQTAGTSNLIENCTNEVNVTTYSNQFSVGGITGGNVQSATLTINNSKNIGTITNGDNNGGLIGFNKGTLTINNSINEGKLVNNVGKMTGGLLGNSSDSADIVEIKNSHNSGQIITNNITTDETITVGGLVATAFGKITINDSYNTADIVNINKDVQLTHMAGGILGRTGINAESYINNTYNTGNIEGGNRLGGIVGAIGQNAIAIIDKSWNSGNLNTESKSSSTAGGILGLNYMGSAAILNSYNLGQIYGKTYDFSGILGSIYNSTLNNYIINSYNIGSVNAAGSQGITRVYNSPVITMNNIYNLGTLTANTKLGIAYISATATYDVSNAYHLSGINGSNISNITTPMSEANMKSSTLVNTLNSNISSIDLSSIDLLKNYTLSSWKLGEDGYPTFE